MPFLDVCLPIEQTIRLERTHILEVSVSIFADEEQSQRIPTRKG